MILVLWAHLTAAVTWIGGMVFLALVLAPVFRRAGFSGEHRVLFKELALRFRVVVWAAIAVLVVTGPILLTWQVKTIGPHGEWPVILTVKLVLVVIVVGLTGIHDFWLGPLAQGSSGTDSGGVGARLARFNSWIARVALAIGLLILGLGAALVRT